MLLTTDDPSGLLDIQPRWQPPHNHKKTVLIVSHSSAFHLPISRETAASAAPTALVLLWALTAPCNCPCRCAKNQPPTPSATTPRINNSFPTISVGNTMRATPPATIARLVVMLPIIARSG